MRGRYVWLLRRPTGGIFRPRSNRTAGHARRALERMLGLPWRFLHADGWRAEKVPVRARPPKPRLTLVRP